MKNLITIIMLSFFVSSCKQTESSLEKFDMTKYCKNYHVLVDPNNRSMYIFIDRKDRSVRFIIWKDYNYKESGFGYLYNTRLDLPEALANGVLSSASEAVSQAKKNLDPNSRNLLLANVVKIDDNGRWYGFGTIYNDLCPGSDY